MEKDEAYAVGGAAGAESSPARARGANLQMVEVFHEVYDQASALLWGENMQERVAAGKVIPRCEVDISYFNYPGRGRLSATWLGHSSLLINIDGYRIITDPVFPYKLTFFGPERYNGELPLKLSELTSVDITLISHDHLDHLNKESILYLQPICRNFIVPAGVGRLLVEWGVESEKIIELGWWEEYEYTGRIKVAATPVQHLSGRNLFDRDSSLCASWVVQSAWHRIFFSGDSGYFSGFTDIGRIYGPFDLTFIECGAYNQRWGSVHMYPEEAVQAHQNLQGRVLQPIHWGTFNLSFHDWNEPMRRLCRAALRSGVTLSVPIVGETTVYGRKYHGLAWWEEPLLASKDSGREFAPVLRN